MLKKEPKEALHSGSALAADPSALRSLLFKEAPDGAGCSEDFMHRLSEQFTAAVADGKLESSLAMLAGCPQLALMPCRKAFFSALHWSCANVSLAPVTRALLALGCDPLGFPSPEQGDESRHNSPMRWAASSGNLPALVALLQSGARPDLEDLMEACRNAQGGCAMAMVDNSPHLNPFEPAKLGGPCCFEALRESAASLRNALNDRRLMVDEALSRFEEMALQRHLPPAGLDGDAGCRRL